MPPAGLSEAKRRLLERYLRGEAPEPQTAAAADETGPIPASWGQRQVWLHSQLADLPIYNEPVTIHRRGFLDRSALSRSFAEIVRRHEAWRTGFAGDATALFQVVHPPFCPAIDFADLRGEPPEVREGRALSIAAADARRPFDLAAPPLFRATLVRIGDDEHRLYLTLHHIIFDGVSIYRVFLPELAALHDAFAAGRESPLPPPGLPYRTFSRRQRAFGIPESSLDYWRRTLADLPPPLDLPLDRPRPAARTFRGAMLPLGLPGETAKSIHALARREGVTPFMTLLAVFQAVLHRWSGQDAFLVGSVTAGRKESELESVMGFFLRTIVLRADLSDDPMFSTLLRRVRDVTLGAIAHDDVPFERLLGEVDRSGSPDRNPLFSVLFSLEPPIGAVAEGWDLTQIDVQAGTTKFDLSLELDERPGGIVGRFIYNTDLFDGDSIARLARHWRALLDSALADPDLRISDLTMGEETPASIGAPAPSEAPPAPVEFARHAAARPSAEAIRFEGRTTTYGELAVRAERIAAGLRQRGIGRESIVALALPRSDDRVAAILAVGRAGAAWMPLGSEWPPSRVAAVLASARPALVIAPSTSAFGDALSATLADLESEPDPRLETVPCPADLAYVLYTSGSTGEPKGVMIEHRPLANLLAWSQRAYPLGPGDRVLQKAPLEFDASVWELFAPLVAGAALVVAPPGAETDPRAIAKLLRRERVTHLKVVPSLLRMLVAVPEFAGASTLRHVFCGGEELPPDLVRDFFRTSRAELHNLYGPTETCVDVAAHRCRPEDAGRGIPIGTAIDGARLYVLDRRGRKAAAGASGELHVGGLPLARGYLGRGDLTAERFVPDPFGSPGDRLYRTGDRVRRRLDGEIEFLGRLDDQKKVRGIRIEPAEVEMALRRCPGVEDASVVVRGEGPSASLAAYVAAPAAVSSADARRDLARGLRERLSSALPRALVPEAITILASLPLTASGKIDRRSLPEPERFLESAGAPRSAEERILVEIWRDVLGIAGVGIHDNIFDLGGNSLLVFQIAARAARSGYAIPPRLVFEHPTIAELAAAAGTLPATTSGMTELSA